MPEDQLKFIVAVEKGRAAFKAGANDMQKGAARPTRAKDICSALPSMTVSNWVGQVADLSSNGDGKGVLSVEIAKDIQVKTWSMAFADIFDDTLIDPESDLFAKASTLKTGQWVTFSGSFRPGQSDCVKELSLTLRGSIMEPEFIFRFSEINPKNMSLSPNRPVVPVAVGAGVDPVPAVVDRKQLGEQAKLLNQPQAPNELVDRLAPRMPPALWGKLDKFLSEQYKQCWDYLRHGNQRRYIPQVRVMYAPDGSLIGPPVLINPPASPKFLDLADSAVQAVKRCDPLHIPIQYAPYYEEWKGRILRFDAVEMAGE